MKSKRYLWVAVVLCASAILGVLIHFRGNRIVREVNMDLSDITPFGIHSGHEYADLGLSVKWATCNIGASSPSEMGGHFAWAEKSEKSSYTYENYSARRYRYDTARALWGGSWRMPTTEEVRELINNCNIEEVIVNGQKGFRFTSKKNDCTIFFPTKPSEYNEQGVYYRYWTSRTVSDFGGDSEGLPYCLTFFNDDSQEISVSTWIAETGLLVRAVLDYE